MGRDARCNNLSFNPEGMSQYASTPRHSHFLPKWQVCKSSWQLSPVPWGPRVLPRSLQPASLAHPAQWAGIISVIGQFVIGQHVPQDVQVIQVSSDYIMTVSGEVKLAPGKNCKCINIWWIPHNCKLFQILFSDWDRKDICQIDGCITWAILIFSNKDMIGAPPAICLRSLKGH